MTWQWISHRGKIRWLKYGEKTEIITRRTGEKAEQRKPPGQFNLPHCHTFSLGSATHKNTRMRARTHTHSHRHTEVLQGAKKKSLENRKLNVMHFYFTDGRKMNRKHPQD